MPVAGNGPIGILVEVCEALARGDYSGASGLFALTGSDTPDEIARLAEAFGMMVVQVEAREMHLQQVIEELRETQRQLEAAKRALERENTGLQHDVSLMTIGFDAAQRAEEVDRVTGTDVFRTLAGASLALRRRRHGGRL